MTLRVLAWDHPRATRPLAAVSIDSACQALAVNPAELAGREIPTTWDAVLELPSTAAVSSAFHRRPSQTSHLPQGWQ